MVPLRAPSGASAGSVGPKTLPIYIYIYLYMDTEIYILRQYIYTEVYRNT
jgi:hypothetical protein